MSLADAGWEAHLSPKWAGATLADAAKLMGVLKDTEKEHVLEAREFTQAELDAVPTEFDWRTDPRAAKCPSLKEIRDQANCGSCWAFGSTEAMTDRMCIASNGTVTTHLSAQDVTSCDKLGDMGCNGGIPSSVYSYWALSGIVDGGNYGDKTSGCWSYQLEPCAHHVNSSKYPACPDEVKAPKCARECESADKTWAESKVKGSKGYSVCQSTEGASTCAQKMAADIYQNGPITGMFFVKQDFLAYKSGVYEPKLLSAPLGGHAIKIMGFGTEDGKDCDSRRVSFRPSRGSEPDPPPPAQTGSSPIPGTRPGVTTASSRSSAARTPAKLRTPSSTAAPSPATPSRRAAPTEGTRFPLRACLPACLCVAAPIRAPRVDRRDAPRRPREGGRT